MVLLQTLVISVILSMIAVMVMKWVLGRYMLAARNYRSTVAKVHSQGYAPQRFASWNFNLAGVSSSGNSTMDTQAVQYDTTGGSAGMRRFIVSSDEDQ